MDSLFLAFHFSLFGFYYEHVKVLVVMKSSLEGNFGGKIKDDLKQTFTSTFVITVTTNKTKLKIDKL